MLNDCSLMVRGGLFVTNSLRNSGLFYRGRHGPLTENEKQWAKIAWKYFTNNYQPATGMVNSVNNYPYATMGHLAAYLAALVSAYELDIINCNHFCIRLTKLLETLNTMQLFQDKLPNIIYHTETAQPFNFSNQQAEVGWSAIDLGRLLIWLRIIKEYYPNYAETIDKFVLRWDFNDIIDEEGTLYGGQLNNNILIKFQEGRMGWEEYAAKGFQLWGFKTDGASKREFIVKKVYGLEFPYDARDPRITKTHVYVTMDSYILDGLEFNWDLALDNDKKDVSHTDTLSADFATRYYYVQHRRFLNTGIATARTAHQLDCQPYYVFDTILADSYTWDTVNENGKNFRDKANISTRAGMGMWILWKTEYTDYLCELITCCLYDQEQGWYEGQYELTGGINKAFTIDTNSMMLEVLFYKVNGKILLNSWFIVVSLSQRLIFLKGK